MSSTDTRFAGSIPALYEELLVPLVFQPYADDLAARLRDVTDGTVLELAAGTGAVTRALRKALPVSVRILATDLNEAMLAVASRRLQDPTVTFQQANAQALPVADGSVAAMACQFGAMFFPDRVGSYREAKRALRPGGRYVFSVWDRIGLNDVTEIAVEAVAKLFPADPPRFMERTPFGYHDVAAIRRDVESAGFAKVTIDTVEKVTRNTTAADAARGLCEGTPLRGEIEDRNAALLPEATRVAAEALTARFGSGLIDCRMSAHVVTAMK